jgi:hypothetical protein
MMAERGHRGDSVASGMNRPHAEESNDVDTLKALGDWAWLVVPLAAGLGAVTHTLRLRTAATLEASARPPDAPKLRGDGRFTIAVSGSSEHQVALARLAARGTGPDREAALVPEPGRGDEPGRIRVEIEGLVVGHLDRDASRRWLARQGRSRIARTTVRVDARIEPIDAVTAGGPCAWGVRLSLPDPGA